MQIGSITSSYVNRIALSYGEKAEENKNIDSSSPNEEYDSFEKSDVKKIEKESYYTNYNDMGRKILAKDFEIEHSTIQVETKENNCKNCCM